MTRPAHCTDEHLAYLDGLHQRGVTRNIYVAGKALMREFELSVDDARPVLVYWGHCVWGEGPPRPGLRPERKRRWRG